MSKKLLRKKLALMLANLKKKRKYYCELEFLESTNQQTDSGSTNAAAYIDTGIIPNNNTRIECRMQFTTLISGQSKEALNGTTSTAQGTAPSFAWGFASISPYTNFYFGLGAQNLTTSVTRDTNVHTFVLDAKNKTCSIDNTTNSFTSSGSVDSTRSIYLFARHATGEYANKPCNAKIYCCKIYDNETIVRDFIPVLDWNYVPCLYDKVSGQLFYSQGTEEFTAGREIHYVDYLESTGTQYIDTGFKANTTTTKYQTKIEPANITTPQALFGSRNTVNIANSGNCEMFIYQSQFRLDWVNGDGASGLFAPITLDTPNEIEITRGRGVVNGVEYTSTQSTSTTQNYNFLIGNFTNGSSTPFSGGFMGKIYYGKLYSNDVLIRDYIPAIDENGVGFMFDRVSHTIYDNAGTGVYKYPAREIEYLESTGTQYIDTGITINTSTDEVVSDFQLISTTLYQWMMGEHDNGARFGIGVGDGTNKRNIAYGANTYKVKDAQVYNEKHNFKANSNGVFLDDVQIHGYENFASASTVYLFKLNHSGANGAAGKIWHYKHKRNGTISRDLISAFKDGTAGMIDKANNVFYQNAGTGTFTTGKIVEPEYE